MRPNQATLLPLLLMAMGDLPYPHLCCLQPTPPPSHPHTQDPPPTRRPRAIGRGVSYVYNNLIGLFHPQSGGGAGGSDDGYTLLPSEAEAHSETGMASEMVPMRAAARPTQLAVVPTSITTVPTTASPHMPQQYYTTSVQAIQTTSNQGPTVFLPASSVGTVNLL